MNGSSEAGSAAGTAAAVEPSASHNLLRRARAGTHIMTAGSATARAISIGSNLVLIPLVTPRELGLFTVVRAVLLITHMASTLGLTRALLCRKAAPTRDEYAALAGLQAGVAALVLAIGSLWPRAALGLGAIDARWYGWMMLTLSTMVILPFGSGARVRLQRSLAYEKVAVADVTGVLVQNGILVAFALLGSFTHGVFIATAVSVVVTYGLLSYWSPGPLPGTDLRPLRSFVGQSGWFMLSSWATVARESGTSLLIANLIGLPAAGVWGVALRVGQMLNVCFEGFRNAAVPVAVRLAHDLPNLRRLTTTTFADAFALAAPLAGIAFAAIPLAGILWPQWRTATTLAQAYVVPYAIAGSMIAALEPASIATRGSLAVAAEQASALVTAWVGVVIVWAIGSQSLVTVAVSMSVAPALILLLLTNRSIQPHWKHAALRPCVAFIATVLAGVVIRRFGFRPIVELVLIACAGLVWLRPVSRVSVLLGAVRRYHRARNATGGGTVTQPLV